MILSKEEIERAKGWLSALDVNSEFEAISKEIILSYIEELEKENSKQNKMIDEMVDCIYNYDICDYEITDYTYRKCEYIADDEEKPCKECIKEYFEKKAEEK